MLLHALNINYTTFGSRDWCSQANLYFSAKYRPRLQQSVGTLAKHRSKHQIYSPLALFRSGNMSFTRAGRIFEAMLFAVGAYYSFVENRSMLNTTLGRLFSGGSLILHDLWQWREFMGASDWAWQWSSVPTPLESPRAASLDAAVSLRMPSLLPFAAGSAGTSHNASSYSPTSSGDFRQLHALIDALRNSSHRLQCQRRQGQTFMYFDSGNFACYVILYDDSKHTTVVYQ